MYCMRGLKDSVRQQNWVWAGGSGEGAVIMSEFSREVCVDRSRNKLPHRERVVNCSWG